MTTNRNRNRNRKRNRNMIGLGSRVDRAHISLKVALSEPVKDANLVFKLPARLVYPVFG